MSDAPGECAEQEAWVAGRHARLAGLVVRPSLNGAEVILLGIVRGERWGTRCALSGEELAVKPCNLQPSAELMAVLSRDDLELIVNKLQLRGLAAIGRVCRDLKDCAKAVANTLEWQQQCLSLRQLVHGNMPPSLIKQKHVELCQSRLDAGHLAVGPELLETVRYVVRSGGEPEVLKAMFFEPTCGGAKIWLQNDLCALHDPAEEWQDEDGLTLLHHAAMCGASPAMVTMLLRGTMLLDPQYATYLSTTQLSVPVSTADHNGFFPVHHAAMRGSSAEVVRMLLEATDATDVYDHCDHTSSSLLHLALGGGGSLLQPGPPLDDAQNEVAMVFLLEMGEFLQQNYGDVPPVRQPDRFERLPLHLAAIAGAAEPLVAAIIHAYPAAARTRDRNETPPGLVQPMGYLPAHYALGTARDGLYKGCRPSSSEVQATLLAAHPLSEWSIIDLVRAGPAGGEVVLARLAALEMQQGGARPGKIMEELLSGTRRSHPPLGVRGATRRFSHDQLLHVAVAHAAPPAVIAALLRWDPAHARLSSVDGLGLLPLHLAQTAATVALLLEANPGGACDRAVGLLPHYEPLTFALRNGAPDEVCRALAAAEREGRNIEQHFGRLDAFGNAERARGSTHPKTRMVKCTGRDMRALWKGRDEQDKTLRRLLDMALD